MAWPVHEVADPAAEMGSGEQLVAHEAMVATRSTPIEFNDS
jgi:hypothetical protein